MLSPKKEKEVLKEKKNKLESEANGLTEEEMLNAVKFGHEGFVPVIEMIEELAKECRKPEWTVEKKDLLSNKYKPRVIKPKKGKGSFKRKKNEFKV